MGWASGSIVMNEIIEGIKPEIADNATRTRIYKPIIKALQDMDWDTLDESLGLDDAFDTAVREMNPDHFEDPDDEEEGGDGD